MFHTEKLHNVLFWYVKNSKCSFCLLTFNKSIILKKNPWHNLALSLI